ncbi:MAG: anaerobic ribonucleoside-triphosphate reductase activating protein [Eubacterium sp.]|nr:anaerobic ribonucleoside-triphosphate reductase activating protein [Eubacterium sp.]MCM1303405.1 anaerobic ribonucleoside-triphosphate reductase activating protein [Butyrivibrio sp.]MCM1342542.1 anaerobic ribonucleoside-triphosphate reductase activating protein [Muribaculaceae bacterium]MCM1410352.1 anaerobic ribonucleoside-triphosphate reductase activating protein [Lachnospiraceae bacterium]
MNYAAIKKTDVANGPGIRVSLFVSGCTHACKGCFNSEAWDFAYGKPFTAETEREILQALSHAYIKGFSVLGGEPMEPENRGTVLGLLRKVRAAYPEKSIWCYTGYDYEKDLLRWAAEGDGTVRELLELTDVLVDGDFVEEKKNLRLAFRGSENQRLIDVRATKKAGHVVCLPE